jgi:hypothetical protein
MACVVAMALNFSLTQFGRQDIVTYCDFHTEVRGPAGNVLFSLANITSDSFGSSRPTPESERALRTCAVATAYGLFGRPETPHLVAFWLGVICPLFLLLGAAFAALRCFLSIWRAVSLLILASLGTASFTLWLFYILVVSSNTLRHLANDIWSLVIPTALFSGAAGFFGGAFWLWRSRPPKGAA